MSGSSGDEAAGRVRRFADAWRAVRQSGDSLIKMCVTNDGPIYLDENDLRALLDERGQLREAAQLAEAQVAEIGAERSEWQKQAQQNSAVAMILRADRSSWRMLAGSANRRAEQAEAEVERLREANRTLARFGLRMGGRADEQQRQDGEGQA